MNNKNLKSWRLTIFNANNKYLGIILYGSEQNTDFPNTKNWLSKSNKFDSWHYFNVYDRRNDNQFLKRVYRN
ncbi:hypothetical protein J4771_02415 [Candidatus Kaistella beijingensis]|uniref:hypothetical protein n=1 Tax=Candidatus Kaistella beijingensis TaxID=2820270 RepID=UPI001CC7EF48|nr:hypothetical protein [Candidatus Kaistella beijingensis]UBB90230.1 hypothetical protein J4771_02415 [Candidatus Kaistella beijingensis]